MPTASDVSTRLGHLAGIVFTEFTAVALAGALVVLLVARRTMPERQRERVVVGMSLVLLWWFAGTVPSVALVGWAVALWATVEVGAVSMAGRLGTAVLLVVLVVAPVAAIGALGEGPRHAREFIAFATNMVILRAVAYARERWRGELAREPLERVLLALFFFPTFVNGPIETPRRLLGEAIGGATAADVRAGLGRVALGVAKIATVALALPPNWTQVLSNGPHASFVQLWTWAVLLYVWFYLSFSGWSDVAIGLGRLCGRRVIENFDRPWRATDPGDFWRRWHVSLGIWLRDHVYIPLGGNQRHRGVNVLAVFVVSAAWHVWGTLKLLGFGYFPMRAWGGLFLWGLLHAAAVSVFGGRRRGTSGGIATQVATFLFAAFAWVPFFLPGDVSPGEALRMLLRMIVPFV